LCRLTLFKFRIKVLLTKRKPNSPPLLCHQSLQQLLTLSTITPSWLDKVQDGYSKYVKAQQMLTTLSVDPTAVPHFTLVDGILRYKKRVWIGDNPTLQQQILKTLHGALGFPCHFQNNQTSICLVRYKICYPSLCAVVYSVSAS
jgi:hypothetical protein